ncbi:MAG: family 16 glycosylhydrolase, partial [Clostridia bacterium]|nr:family 16 glycosylhydrolase [Clostridia bacterium]
HNHVGNTVSENNYVTEETGLTEGRNYVSAENMTGPNALTVMPLGDAYAATNGYPVLKVFLAKCNHTYDNDCDEDCNLCGEEREAGHNFVDNICTVCGAKDVWNGQISDTAPVDSDSDGWIEINNGAELAYIIKNGGGAENKYILTNDIYLNDITTDFWTNGAPEGVTLNPWFEASQAGNFKGTINGDGHVVYGLYYNASLATGTADGTGLIPRVNENEVVTITNLGVDNAYIKHTKNASAFVGVAYKSGRLVIDKCYVGQNVTIEAAYAGAFRGYANSSNGGSITNSYSLAKTIGTNRGLVATFWEVNGNTLDISNCYNANGPISTHNHVGNTVSENNYVTEETGLTEGRNYVSAENMTGPNALTVMPLGDAYAATNGYPVLKVFYPDYAEPEPDDEIKIDYWNGNMTQPKTDEQGNYLITNGAELAFIIKNGGGAGNVYKLTNDIYLNNLSKVNWKNGQILDNEYSINKWFEAADATDFRGTIDGDGHVIYGLYFADAKAAGGADGAGLIPRINAGSVVTIKNLGIDNAYINHTVSAAAFVGVGYQSGELTMDSCYAGANVTVKAQYAGAFRGYSLKTANELITNSYSLAATDGTQMGLFAYIYHASGNMLTISNCYNANGPISTHAANGEVVATNCYESYYRTQQSTILYVDGITGVATADMVGVGVLSQDGKLSGLNANNKFIAMADTYPMLKVFFKLELQKNGKTYIGNKYNSMSDYYVVASDFSDYFWRYEHVDANTDNAFNIADLVYMKLKLDSGEYAADLDYDLTTTIYDLTLLRRVLTGDKEFAVKPYNKEYQISNSKISTGYSLVWKDEFDGTSIDTNKWNPEGGQMGGANSDVTITPTYNDRTTSVADGKLKLTAYKASGNEYIIPKAIASNGTMNYKYGYVEIRAKIPTESGAFSSFWTRSVSDTTSTLINGKLDHYAEVDMFEVFSHTSTGGNNALAATILKNFPEDRSKDWYSADMTNGQQPTNYIDDEYHIFGYEWTPYEMKMYIDGELYARFDITVSWNQGPVAGKGKDGWSVTWYTEAKHPKVFDKSGTGMESFHEAQYLIFNNYLHHANSAGISVANNSSFTQAEYIIDYCRVYQLDGQEIYTK